MEIGISIYFTLMIIATGHAGAAAGGEDAQRSKRWLLEPDETQFGVFVTLSWPLENMSTVSVAYFFEGNYYTLSNVSYLDPFLVDVPVVSSRHNVQARSLNIENDTKINRKFVYSLIQQFIASKGFDGLQCLLQAICENATAGFHYGGPLGQLLYILFTPSSSREEGVQDEFYIAELNGLNRNCAQYHDNCSYRLLDELSTFIE